LPFFKPEWRLLSGRELAVMLRSGFPAALLLVCALYSVEDRTSAAGSVTAYTEVLCRRTLLLITPLVWLYGALRLVTFGRQGTGEIETVAGVRPVTRLGAYAAALLLVTVACVFGTSLLTLLTVDALRELLSPATLLHLALNVLQLCTVIAAAGSVIWLARGPWLTAALFVLAGAVPFVVFPASNHLQRLPEGAALSDTFGVDRLVLVTALELLLTLGVCGCVLWLLSAAGRRGPGAWTALGGAVALGTLLVTPPPSALYNPAAYRRAAVAAALEHPETLHRARRWGQSELYVSSASLPEAQALASSLRIADLQIVEVPFLTTPTWRKTQRPVLLIPEWRPSARPGALTRLVFERMIPAAPEGGRRMLAQEWACMRQFGQHIDLSREQALWKAYLAGDVRALTGLSQLGAMQDSVINEDVERAFQTQRQEVCPSAPYLLPS
jgi:hypothetical protein